jgi:hypothetical protein
VTPHDLDSLLHRPFEQRVREYRYRFAQSMVFGLPVIALELWGRALGGAEAERWVMFIQLLLAGWVMYVGATGMLSENVLLLGRRCSADLPVAAAALAIFLAGAISFAAVIASGHALLGRGWFAGAVALVAVWTGLRWAWGAARQRRDGRA